MKKKTVIIILVIMLVAALVIPIPLQPLNAGGTRIYQALTYRIVQWDTMTPDGPLQATRVYWLLEAHQPMDSLMFREMETMPNKFYATVIEINGTSVVVEPLTSQWERSSSDRISFSTADLEHLNIQVGARVQITYNGAIMESYPAQIDAISWKLCEPMSQMPYAGVWLAPESSQPSTYSVSELVITEIYSDCFFAVPAIPSFYILKINGELDDSWCVGDMVSCTYGNVYEDAENYRIEADLKTIGLSNIDQGGIVCYKPVIYLYPTEETEVSVKLALDGKLTCTYPAYGQGWNVTAYPDGTLTDWQGQTYNYLYWEGNTSIEYDMSRGFCVKGEDTAAFLEYALAKQGLTRREANEFIVYWLPLMQDNPYNIISFQTDRYTSAVDLQISPAPDTVIRVFMTWQTSDTAVDIVPQELTPTERIGFAVVEWGGTEIK